MVVNGDVVKLTCDPTVNIYAEPRGWRVATRVHTCVPVAIAKIAEGTMIVEGGP